MDIVIFSYKIGIGDQSIDLDMTRDKLHHAQSDRIIFIGGMNK